MLLAFLLRFAGLGYLLPCSTEPDSVYVVQIRYLRGSDPGLAQHHYMYDYPRAVAYGAAALAGAAQSPSKGAPLEEHLADAGRNVLAARFIIAASAALAVPATWFLARAFLPFGGALAAAWLVAVSLLNVNFSQQARPHAAVAGLAAVALCAALRLRRQPGWREYLLAGLAGSATFAVLHNGLLLVPALVAAHLLREGPRGNRLRLASMLAPFALCVPLLYSDMLRVREGQGAGLHLEDNVLSFGSHTIPVTAFNGEGALQMLAGLWSFDPVFCLLALAGLVRLALADWGEPATRSSRRRDFAVLAAFGLPYAIAFGAFRDSYPRFALPLLPLLAIPAAHGWVGLVRAAALLGRAPAVATGAVLLVLSGIGGVKLAWLRTQPDSLQQAAAWVRAHVEPQRERLWLHPGLELPVLTTPAATDWNAGETPQPYLYLWTHYLALTRPDPPGEQRFDARLLPWYHESYQDRLRADPSAAVGELEGDLVMLAVYSGDLLFDFTGSLQRGLAERGQLQARFVPIQDGGHSRPLMYEILPLEPSVLLSVLRARCVGPVIEVYRVGPRRLRGG